MDRFMDRDRQNELEEGIVNAISRRIMHVNHDLLSKYGVVAVTDAISRKASQLAEYGLEEIGSSDISIWVKQIESELEDEQKYVEKMKNKSGSVAESPENPELHKARVAYAKNYAKNTRTVHDSKEAQKKAYDMVGKMFGDKTLSLLKDFHQRNEQGLDEAAGDLRSEYDANRSLGPSEQSLIVVVSKPGDPEGKVSKKVKIKGTDDAAKAADAARKHFQAKGYRVHDAYPEGSEGMSMAEGAVKDLMFGDAETMNIDDFVEKYGDEDWVREFWDAINGELTSSGTKHEEMSEDAASALDSDNPTISNRIELAKKATALFREQQEVGTPGDLYFAIRWFLTASPKDIKQELEILQRFLNKTKK